VTEFILAVLALLVAAVVGMLMNWIPRPEKISLRTIIASAVAFIVLGGGVATFAAATAGSRDDMSSSTSAPGVSGGQVAADAPITSTSAVSATTSASATTDSASSRAVYLAEVDPVDRGQISFGNSPSSVNGQACPQPINISRNPGVRATLDYDLGRRYSSFSARVGLRDDSDPESVQRFEVFADGEMLFQADVAFGQLQQIDVSIAGKLRLQLAVTTINDDYHRAVATWCDPQIRS
jgi:hypothetical protein